MMEWYQAISYLFTNGIRIFLCLCLVETLLEFPKMGKKTALASCGSAVIITILSLFSIPQLYLLGSETMILAAVIYCLFQKEMRLSFFIIFFYEVGTALWEFIVSAGLGILFCSERFLDTRAPHYMAAVWIVRLSMAGLAFSAKKHITAGRDTFRQASLIAVLGMICIVSLSEQSVLSLDDDQLTVWLILSLMQLAAILLFNMNRQYEMEKEIAKLTAEQAELLERDYQMLNQMYSANARLFHDFHNHVEVLYRYLSRGAADEAAEYLKDMRTPVQEMMQDVWTGEEAIDYLINSKMAAARQAQIQTEVNVEFPNHTDIRSADLTALLGNLLDNALEAAGAADKGLRFIRLIIRRINNMVIIKVENGCTSDSLMETGEGQTLKEDKSLHGWGLKNARAAAERYEGTIELSCENHIFRAVATLFFEPVKRK